MHMMFYCRADDYLLHDFFHLLYALIWLLICKITFWRTPTLKQHKKRSWRKQISTLSSMAFKFGYFKKSRSFIPTCRLKPLPLVRPIREFDVHLLENKFLNGYRARVGHSYMYIIAQLWRKVICHGLFI